MSTVIDEMSAEIFSQMEISATDIDRLAKDLQAKDLGPQTVKHVLAQLRRIMCKCQDWGLWTGQMPKFDMPDVHNERFRFLTVLEAAALMDELGRRAPALRNLCEVSLHTGMRRGELLGLKGFHLDMHSGTIQILDGKKGKPRVAFMTDAVIEIFRRINPAPGTPRLFHIVRSHPKLESVFFQTLSPSFE